MEILIIGVLIVVVFQYTRNLDVNQFLNDNKQYFEALKESDYEFLLRAKYGENVNVETMFMKRIKNGLITIVILTFVFLTSLSFINIIAAVVVGFLVFKSQYSNLKKYYKVHLHEINSALPYYLKSLEILIHHYTVPVALARSVEDAPPIFRVGLKKLLEKINAGDSSINPYMDFAIEYPVRDSMRMMRLLYRLGLGSQENKHEQLLSFSRSVSNLQNKSREQKYKSRLEKMEKKTMTMLVCTGGGTMLLLLISIFMMMGV